MNEVDIIIPCGAKGSNNKLYKETVGVKKTGVKRVYIYTLLTTPAFEPPLLAREEKTNVRESQKTKTE